LGLFDRLIKRPKGVEPPIGQRVWVGLAFLLEAGGWTAKSSGV
jgi:hypothetical protein